MVSHLYDYVFIPFQENLSPVSSGNSNSGLFGSLTTTNSGLFGSLTTTGSSTALTNTAINATLFGEPKFSPSQTENKPTGMTSVALSSSSLPQINTQLNTLAPRSLFSSPESTMVNPFHSSLLETSAATVGTSPDDDTSELTEEELQAFKANLFVFKAIPEHIPPPYLCQKCASPINYVQHVYLWHFVFY